MNLLKNKTVGFYIQAIVPVFCLISLITYLVYASAMGKYDVKILLGLGLGCVLGALQLFLQIGVFELLSSVLISVTLFYFITLTETIGSYADYLNNIVAFGHSELIGQINATIITTLVTAVLAIVGCFVSGQKEQVGK